MTQPQDSISYHALLAEDIQRSVAAALAEDIGDGDITAELIPADRQAKARIITREPMIFCGKAWVEAVFAAVDSSVEIGWEVGDGDRVEPNATLFTLSGNARSLLTGERCALNYVQTLSATATVTEQYASKIAHTKANILDTRKTIPGLRLAQKYAVTCGQGNNHRIGLYDAFLIKENHIFACGGIEQAISTAKKNHPGKPVEVEVESMAELEQALAAGADIIMLDNFDIEATCKAVALTDGKAKLESSGNITDETLVSVAETGIDFISIGALTKHVQAIDLSMRLVMGD